ncbi:MULTISPECIES: protease modulator HflC [Thalassospira]|mgnify:FL=1|jgi:membrane protease subunit HflC|uniref:Protein HflC n=4 Tax=Thalassospira TaxID=168934 RepID=A0A367V3W4_9PROT|nr:MULTISPECIES: protease modulator HflC [Thalassospira]MBR9899728.1 protease modulator HflC [Rhodospirillales bacterium]KZB70595.1 protease modulator HflC [Thalassospira sp. MCCC 1A01148]MBO6805511.1 protease modulator HflC [Thalassospira sp.]MBS8273804.1 protease modulator HflC [Thalassospira tepidiphila]RCK19856.1 membrane protein [Thalassospira profundimaris]|tara:strand:+ start:12578 stop:13450 length:873 start_codon:yes stop_codon:yes gene_type:complete
MASPKLIAAGVVLVIAAVVGSMSVFTVRQDQQALVLQFGNPVHAVSEPGLHFKLPIQNVEYYERRILELDPPVQQVLLSDQKRVNVDSFARWKIIDPLIFRQRATNSANFVQLFGQRLNSVIRGELAQAPLVTLLSDNRAQIMEKIQATLIKPAEEFGVELIDVRIGRTDLPQETSQAVYNRMRSSRIAEAAQLRAEGEELKAKIQAEADRERIGIIAEANRQAEVLRGEGDGQRNVILGKAYGKDAEFFEFYRSLEAYKIALDNGSTMVLSPDSEFFQYFNKSGPATSR